MDKLLKYFVAFYFLLNIVSSNRIPDIEENEVDGNFNLKENVPELVNKYGYPFEIYSTVTKDGYILNLHRIPFRSKIGQYSNKGVVLIQHGFGSNSGEILVSGPNNSLAFILADSGYDVWLGNTRGNRYSNKHIKFASNSQRYWDFSFSDIGYYDVPAIIDHILKVTKEKQIFYIGHSRGTTIFYVMCSTLPEYNKKIRAMISLAPVSYMKYYPSTFIQNLARVLRHFSIYDSLKSMGFYRIALNRKEVIKFGDFYCRDNKTTQLRCARILSTFGGFDPNFDMSLLPIIFRHYPDSIPLKEIFHYSQIIVSGEFRDFNYGYLRNLLKYHLSHPPKYNLSKISAPVAIFYTDGDLVSSVTDADHLYSELPNPIGKYLISEIKTHFYFFLKNIKTILFDKILKIMEQY